MPSSRLGPGKNKTATPRMKRGKTNRSDLRKTTLLREASKQKMNLDLYIRRLEKQLSLALNLRRMMEKRPRSHNNMNESPSKRRLFNEI